MTSNVSQWYTKYATDFYIKAFVINRFYILKKLYNNQSVRGVFENQKLTKSLFTQKLRRLGQNGFLVFIFS